VKELAERYHATINNDVRKLSDDYFEIEITSDNLELFNRLVDYIREFKVVE